MNLIEQRRAEKAAREAEAERVARERVEEELLSPTLEPAPTTDFQHALAQAITAGADTLRSNLESSNPPHSQVVAARALYAADADALYTTIRAQAAAAPRDLSSFEAQRTLTWLRRELDASVTRTLATIDVIRQDAQQHMPARLHNFLKAERAKRDRQTRTTTITDAERAEELGLRRPVRVASIIPPAGHPDHDRLMNEAMAIREAAETVE
jgi:hypothetical protein